MIVINSFAFHDAQVQKNNNLLKTNRILKPNETLSGGPFFTFSLPGRQFAPLTPSVVSLPFRTYQNTTQFSAICDSAGCTTNQRL